MEFEADPMQDGRFKLARRIAVAPTMPNGEPGLTVTFAVVGMAGAVAVQIAFVSPRRNQAVELVDPATSITEMRTVDAMPVGFNAYAYRPWPSNPGAERVATPLLHGGYGYEEPVNPHGAVSLMDDVLNTDNFATAHESLWATLYARYRGEFEAALSPGEYAEQERRDGALEAYERAAAGPEVTEQLTTYPETEAPPWAGPRRWTKCPECESTDEASDTPCTNLTCPSHARRGTMVAERIEAELLDPADAP